MKTGTKLVWMAATAVIAAGGVKYAKACFYGIEGGVHFRSAPVDFGQPPNRIAFSYSMTDPDDAPFRPGTRYLYDDADVAGDDLQKKVDDAFGLARSKEMTGDYVAAVAAYQAGAANLPEPYRFFASKRELVLTLAEKETNRKGLVEYLTATHWDKPNDALTDEAVVAPWLQPFVSYEGAAASFHAKAYSEAARRYLASAKKYPSSDLSQAALIMAARSALLQDSPTTADLQLAEDALGVLAKTVDGQRFRFSIDGLKARQAFLAGHIDQAEALYSSQLEEAASDQDKRQAVDSLLICARQRKAPERIAELLLRRFDLLYKTSDRIYSERQFQGQVEHLTTAQSVQLASALKADPQMMSSYLELRLELSPITAKERSKVLKMALESSASNSGRRGADELLSRIAQIYYLDGLYDKALAASKTANSASTRGSAAWSRAQYVFAGAQSKLHHPEAAVSGYLELIAQSPDSYLVPGAREALAYLYDRSGELGKALDQYFALKYDADAAYLLDAKMTEGQIRNYIFIHPNHPQHDVLVYSLGMRLLRENQLKKAEGVLATLTEAKRAEFCKDATDMFHSELHEQDPLQTAQDLIKLNDTLAAAKGDDARATAMYALASYYYEHRNVLLYNYPLWQGGRAISIGASWNRATAAPEDEQALTTHHFEHECAYRAYQICQSILTQYPKSRVASKAAYRAACAADHLADFNPWWRWKASRLKLESKAGSLMLWIPEHDPKNPLAKLASKYGKLFVKQAREADQQGFWKNAPEHWGRVN